MITLRKIEPADLPYLYQWENDASSWSSGNNHNPLSQKDLRDYISSSTGDIYKDGQLRLMIIANDCIVGCIDLFDFDVRNRRAAIGMYIAPEFRRQGYGQAAVIEFEQYAFSFLHLRTIYAVIAAHNIACRSIYEQRGFASVGPLSAWTLEDDAWIYTKNNETGI